MCEYVYQEVEIGDIKDMLNHYDIEVDSPDGWVEILEYVDKGNHIGYELICNNKRIISSPNHLYETNVGWLFAKDIDDSHLILCDDGEYHNVNIKKLDDYYDVCDVVINHPNHRYYTNGVSSHNTNLGKTLLKCSMAANILLQNKSVLYITMEMSEEKIAERIYQNILSIDRESLSVLTREKFHDKVTNIVKKISNNLFIKEYPNKGANVGTFKNLIKELEIKHRFKPDVIFIDYMGITAPTFMLKSDNTYTEGKRVSEELRGLSVELEPPVVSSLQTNRSSFDEVITSLDAMADSIGPAATADIVVGVSQTDDMKLVNKFAGIVLKNRYGANKAKISFNVDYHKMMVTSDDSQDISKPIPQAQTQISKVKDAVQLTNTEIKKDIKNVQKKTIDFE